jgi:hypothetical protein
MTKKLVCGSMFTLFLLVAGAAWSEEAASSMAPAPQKAVAAEAVALEPAAAEAPAGAPAPAIDAETTAALAALFQSLSSELQGPAPVYKACVASAGGCQCSGSCTGGGCFCSAGSCCATCCAAYRSQCC